MGMIRGAAAAAEVTRRGNRGGDCGVVEFGLSYPPKIEMLNRRRTDKYRLPQQLKWHGQLVHLHKLPRRILLAGLGVTDNGTPRPSTFKYELWNPHTNAIQ